MKTSEPSDVIYVRVPAELKTNLRALADTRYGGNMAEALRHVLTRHIEVDRRETDRLEKEGAGG